MLDCEKYPHLSLVQPVSPTCKASEIASSNLSMEHTASEPIHRVSEVPANRSLSLSEFFEKQRDINIEVDTDDSTVHIDATDDDSIVSLLLDEVFDQRNKETLKGRQIRLGSLDDFFEKERDSSTTIMSSFNDSDSTFAIVCLSDEDKMQEKTTSRVEIESIEQVSPNSVSQRQRRVDEHFHPAAEETEDTLQPHMGTDTVTVCALETIENKRAPLREMCTYITQKLDSSQHDLQEVMTRSFKMRRVRFQDEHSVSADERTRMQAEMNQTTEERNIGSLTNEIFSLKANIEDLKKVAETHKSRAQHFKDENYNLTIIAEEENSHHNGILCELEKLEVEHVAMTQLCIQLAKKGTFLQIEVLEESNFFKTNHVGKDDLQKMKDNLSSKFHPEDGEDELEALEERHIALHRLCKHLTKKNKGMKQIVDQSGTKP